MLLLILTFMCAGFDQVTQQLPKFDIDKHGNRLDKPLDPYGEIAPPPPPPPPTLPP